MRFMMFMIPSPEQQARIDGGDSIPDVESVAAMSKYNEAMLEAGVMLSGEGLHPRSEGARVEFRGGKGTVVDGPFAEAKEVIGGFWMIEVKSREEAVQWALRCPEKNCTLELRRVYELEEFPPDVQAAAVP
jgi:hypothetical protein